MAAGCTGDRQGTETVVAQGQEVLAIAFMGPLTGDGASLGANMLNGARLAVEEATAGNALPVRLELEVFDTQLDPAQARTLADRVLEDPRMVGVVGPVSSGEMKAAAPTFDQAGLPVVTPSASNPELARQGWKVFHRIVANDDVQSAELARYVSAGLHAAHLAVVHDSTEYGKGLAQLTKKAVEEGGVTVDVFEAIDPRATDFSAVVNNIKARRSPVVVFAGLYSEAGRLLRQLRDAGVDAAFLSGDGSKDPGIAAGAGAAAEGVTVTCACAEPSTQDDPKARAFTEAYTRRFGAPPGTYAAEGYDAANVFIEVLRRGARTPAAVLAAMAPGMPAFDGLTKQIAFTGTGEVTAATVYVYSFRGGRFTLRGTVDDLAA